MKTTSISIYGIVSSKSVYTQQWSEPNSISATPAGPRWALPMQTLYRLERETPSLFFTPLEALGASFKHVRRLTSRPLQ